MLRKANAAAKSFSSLSKLRNREERRLLSRRGHLPICGTSTSIGSKWFDIAVASIFLIDWPVVFCALRDVECATAPEPGDLRAAGKVTFPVSCAPAVQSEFARGVALLHSFFYEEARRVFTVGRRTRPKMRDGAVGNRDDVVASDLDAAHSR